MLRKNLISISLATDYTFKQSEPFKKYLENPDAFKSESKEEEPEKEEEEEPEKEADKEEEKDEESDGAIGGGLFGDADED